jgi:adenosylcobinamide-GDP ribazoletransferase
MTTSPAWDEWAPWFARRAHELSAAILFLTRLPLPRHAPEDGAVARGAWAFPLAGFVVGLIAAVVYAIAHALVLFPWPAAALAIAATLLVTGCLHEDGLADTADGFGGGDTRGRKLDIMRDSRIGTYGVCALTLSILLRVSAIASLGNPIVVLWTLIAAHGAARAAIPVFMALVPPARRDGLAFAAGRPSGERVITASVLGILILAIGLGPSLGIAALILLLVAIVLMAWLSVVQIDGQTGDVLGAVEQVGEIVVLLVALR